MKSNAPISRTAAHGAHNADTAEQIKLKKAAKQFEAIFVEKMLSAMKKSVPESGLTHKGAGSGMYDAMIDRAVADHMSNGSGVGIADYLYRQWTGERMGPVVHQAGPMMPSGRHALEAAGPAESPAMAPASMFESTSPLNLNHRGVDDGLTPLRDLLPPTGLEGADLSWNPSSKKIEESLNGPGNGPDERHVDPSLAGGEEADYEDRQTLSTSTAPAEAGGHRAGQSYGAVRDQALRTYRRHVDRDEQSRHTGDIGAAGARA